MCFGGATLHVYLFIHKGFNVIIIFKCLNAKFVNRQLFMRVGSSTFVLVMF